MDESALFQRLLDDNHLIRTMSWFDPTVYYNLSLVSRSFAQYIVLGHTGKFWRRNMKKRFAEQCGWTLRLVKDVPVENFNTDVYFYHRNNVLSDFCGEAAIRATKRRAFHFRNGELISFVDKRGNQLKKKPYNPFLCVPVLENLILIWRVVKGEYKFIKIDPTEWKFK